MSATVITFAKTLVIVLVIASVLIALLYTQLRQRHATYTQDARWRRRYGGNVSRDGLLGHVYLSVHEKPRRGCHYRDEILITTTLTLQSSDGTILNLSSEVTSSMSLVLSTDVRDGVLTPCPGRSGYPGSPSSRQCQAPSHMSQFPPQRPRRGLSSSSALPRGVQGVRSRSRRSSNS